MAAVSSSELAWPSVREDRSWLPLAISLVARRTDSADWRMRSSTAAILSANWLKPWAICASSSRPCASRRLVRSPSPEAMPCSASRTSVRRRSMRHHGRHHHAGQQHKDDGAEHGGLAQGSGRADRASASSATTASIQGVPSTLAA